MIAIICLLLLIIFLASISQVLLKVGSNIRNQKKSVLAPYLNVHTLCSYGLFLIVTVISVIVLKEGVPLKNYNSITSLVYVCVIGLSWGLLNEEVTKKTIVGILLIIGGVVVFNF